MIDKYISSLVFFKILISCLILNFFAIYLGWDMFKYPDFYSSYSKCSNEYYPNILYGKLFCGLNSITGMNFTHRSYTFIFLASVINMSILIAYFKILKKYLNKNGQWLFVGLLVLHPYMGIYFFRFYTDIFASIGIFLIFYYIINNRKIDSYFLVYGLLLMNFRVALIPVFLLHSIIEIYKNYKNYTFLYKPILLMIFSIISLIFVLDFSINFSQINSEVRLFEKIIYNFIFTFGFRESFVGVFREVFWGGDQLNPSIQNPVLFFSEFQKLDYIAFVISIILLIIHIIGLLGIFKFSIRKKVFILVLFAYIFVPIFSIAHMRYLLPLMPILLFGFSYILSQKTLKI